jgi:hypothetical protein
MHVMASKVRYRNRQLAEFPALKLLEFFQLKVLNVILQVYELHSQTCDEFFPAFSWMAG